MVQAERGQGDGEPLGEGVGVGDGVGDMPGRHCSTLPVLGTRSMQVRRQTSLVYSVVTNQR